MEVGTQIQHNIGNEVEGCFDIAPDLIGINDLESTLVPVDLEFLTDNLVEVLEEYRNIRYKTEYQSEMYESSMQNGKTPHQETPGNKHLSHATTPPSTEHSWNDVQADTNSYLPNWYDAYTTVHTQSLGAQCNTATEPQLYTSNRATATAHLSEGGNSNSTAYMASTEAAYMSSYTQINSQDTANSVELHSEELQTGNASINVSNDRDGELATVPEVKFLTFEDSDPFNLDECFNRCFTTYEEFYKTKRGNYVGNYGTYLGEASTVGWDGEAERGVFAIPKLYGCLFCPRNFYSRMASHRHQVCHAKQQLRCPYCKTRSRNMNGLRRHINYFHYRLYRSY